MTIGDELPSVSVVIPCLDAAETLGAQLDALAHQTYPGTYEVIVADNGSTDASRAVAVDGGATVVDATGRRGPNHARNAGAARARGRKILVCDADDVVADGWIEAMSEALDSYDVAGGAMDWALLNEVEFPWVDGMLYDKPRFGYLPAASGANFGIRSDVLWALGGWDESFEGGPDEVELCWRAQLAGYTLGYTKDAVVHYRLRPTTLALARQIYRRASYLPLLFRRFRGARPADRVPVSKAARYGAFVLLAWPAAIVSRRWRREWARRAAFGAGLARGLLRGTPDPAFGLQGRPRPGT